MCHVCLRNAAAEWEKQDALRPGEVLDDRDLPVWSTSQVIEQLASLWKTNAEVIKFVFPKTGDFWRKIDKDGNLVTNGQGEETGHSELNAFQQSQARIIYSLWDDLIAREFEETSDPFTADISISNTTTGIGYAHAWMPIDGVVAGAAWLNSNEVDLQNPATGSYGYLTMIHEVGHTLGLDHAGHYHLTPGPSHAQDSHMHTVMSYFTAALAGADTSGADNKVYFPQTPMLHDVAAIQAVYGADMTTRTGDTVYGFNSNTNSPIFDFTQNANPIVTIWDAGGIDTLDLSGFPPGNGNLGSRINLAPGSFSDAAAMTNNISVAYGAWIENAIGGRGDDEITGNMLANRLIGNAGDDRLHGGDGDDYLDGGAGRDTLNGGAGDDTLVYDAADGVHALNGGEGTDLLLIQSVVVPKLDLQALEIEFADHVQSGSSGSSWSVKTDHYDAHWRKLSQDGEAKSGEHWKTVWDVENQKWWSSYTFTYDEDGRRYAQTGERDVGTSWRHTYDVDGSEDWSRLTDNYDSQGRMFNRSGEFDNGETWSQFLDAGSRYWWTHITSHYTANGERYQQIGERDNGQIWTHQWDLGKTADWSWKTHSEDLSDLTWWRENTLFYNDDGQVYRQTGARDNGDFWEHLWDREGTESWYRQTRYQDVEGSRDWFERIQTFDQNGTLVSTLYVDDIA